MMDNHMKILIFLTLLLVKTLLVLSNEDTELMNEFSQKSKSQQAPKKATTVEKKSDSKSEKNNKNLPPKLSNFEKKHIESKIPNVTVSYEAFDEKNFTDISSQDQNVVKANFSYFEVTYYKDPKKALALWIDINSFNDSQFVHEVLSNSHRRAASISLPFNFSFYGNNLTKTTVATGGFLYMGEHVHSWLAATQYIAPLMANFDTRNSSSAQILYGYNSTVFVIEWDNVMLQEKPELEFTFQCSIHSNGDIVFVYKKIPIPIEKISNAHHPVKVGVSDAYFINRHKIFVRRKTIYEYHKIDLMKSDDWQISSNTAIYLKALPTCNTFKTCDTCLTSVTPFNCVWCEIVQRCSDGYDRQRQEWVAYHCEQEYIQEKAKCSAMSSSSPTSLHINNSSASTMNNVTPSPTIFHNSSTSTINDHHQHSENIDIHDDKNLTNLEYNTQEHRIGNIPNKNSTAHSSLAISMFFLISIVLGFSLWIIYAYRNPTSTSGQFLIRWRPSTWRWNGGETRYTAASIHM